MLPQNCTYSIYQYINYKVTKTKLRNKTTYGLNLKLSKTSLHNKYYLNFFFIFMQYYTVLMLLLLHQTTQTYYGTSWITKYNYKITVSPGQSCFQIV